MSYCRPSCERWKSDVYVYEGQNGFNIHVAKVRIVNVESCPEGMLEVLARKGGEDEALAAASAQSAWLESATRVPIELAHAGCSFVLEDAEECLAQLIALRELGYYIPVKAIDALTEEACEA